MLGPYSDEEVIIVDGEMTRADSPSEQVEATDPATLVLINHFKEKHIDAKVLLIKALTQRKQINRIFNNLNISKYPEDLLKLLDGIPRPAEGEMVKTSDAFLENFIDSRTLPQTTPLTERMMDWLTLVEDRLNDCFIKSDGTLSNRLKYEIGLIYCDEMKEFMGWDPKSLPNEIVLVAYKLYSNVFSINWLANDQILAQDIIGAIKLASVFDACLRSILRNNEISRAKGEEPDHIGDTMWTNIVARCSNSAAHQKEDPLLEYGFSEALIKSKFIRSGTPINSGNDLSIYNTTDPILKDIYDFIRLFSVLNFAPKDYSNGAMELADMFPNEHIILARTFSRYYETGTISRWVEAAGASLFDYLFNPDLSVKDSLKGAGITDDDIKFFADAGNMTRDQLSHLIFSQYLIKFMQMCYILMLKENQNSAEPQDIDLVDWMRQLGEVFERVGKLNLVIEYDKENYEYSFSIKSKQCEVFSSSENDEISMSDGEGIATSAMLAAQRGHLTVIQQLSNASFQYIQGALPIAIESGNLPIVSYLVKAGASLDFTIARGGLVFTALELAAVNGHLHIVKYLVEEAKVANIKETFLSLPHQSRPVLQYLFNRLAPSEVKEVYEKATQSIDIEKIKFILENFQFSKKTKDELLQLTFKQDRHGSHLPIIQLLLDYGASYKQENECALNSVHLTTFLKEFNPEYRNANGYYALHQAILEKNSLLVEYLVKNAVNVKAIVNQKSKGGVVPLHAAVRINNPDVAQYLIDNGAEVDVPNMIGHTPLMAAIFCGSREMVRCLLKNNSSYATAIHPAHFSAIECVFNLDDGAEPKKRIKCLPDFLAYEPSIKKYNLSPKGNLLLLKALPKFQEIQLIDISDMEAECRSTIFHIVGEVFSDFWNAVLSAIENMQNTSFTTLGNNLTDAQIASKVVAASKGMSLSENVDREKELRNDEAGPSERHEIIKEGYDKLIFEINKLITALSARRCDDGELADYYSPYKKRYDALLAKIETLQNLTTRYRQHEEAISKSMGKQEENGQTSDQKLNESLIKDLLTLKMYLTDAQAFPKSREYESLNYIDSKLLRFIKMFSTEIDVMAESSLLCFSARMTRRGALSSGSEKDEEQGETPEGRLTQSMSELRY
jgi:ankyrin repeat protein